MKKKLLVCSILAAATSMQAHAFKFDTDGDWNIRWDNSLKANVMSRVAKQDSGILDPAKTKPSPTAAGLADDADYSVDRSNGGIVSTRFDLLSEMDIVWKDTFGVRVSGAGWYDPAYKDSDHPKDGPTSYYPSGYSTWGSLTVQPGEYTDAAKDLHYKGGELLDAFVFANVDIGDVSANVRVGRHTLYWGQSALSTGAIHGFAGSMAAIDVSKGRGAPGTEVKELFIPNGKVSTLVQLTDNLTFNAFYAYEFEPLRWPEAGTYFSLNELLTEDSEFLTVTPGTGPIVGVDTPRSGLKANDYKAKDAGDWGINFQYYFESLDLETSFIYMNNTDRLTSGLYSVFDGASPEEAALAQETNALIIGHYGWVYKDDIDTFGMSMSKEMAGISWGADLVYRRNNALNPDLTASLSAPLASEADADVGDRYPGPTGDTIHIVINGIGFLNGGLGLWDGGVYIVEATFSQLEEWGQFPEKANPFIHKGRWTSDIAFRVKPTWFQVLPGWDMSVPMTLSYTIDGEQAPNSAGGNEEVGNASVGLEFLIRETYIFSAAYNAYFGPQGNGTSAFVADRDNISLTLKRTF